MDFAPTLKVRVLVEQITAFMNRFVYASERTFYERIEAWDGADEVHKVKIAEHEMRPWT